MLFGNANSINNKYLLLILKHFFVIQGISLTYFNVYKYMFK